MGKRALGNRDIIASYKNFHGKRAVLHKHKTALFDDVYSLVFKLR